MALVASLKEFLLEALRQDQRLDGRKPYESRSLTINLAREDGTAEVQLGQTHIMCVVTCQLVQPYPDEPNEGIIAVYMEFSPMADPTFEVGRPGENAVELGRVIERGLRDSRAIDTESLCVLSGKAVWLLRVDIHVLDNGGNLIDAASIAALAGLLSFRKPECGLEGAQRQDVVIYPPEVCEPVPLVVHYLPIAFTFGFFGDGELMVIDPSYKEELLMRGRLTIILSVDGDICAIQKAGGVGVSACEILHCLQIASTKVAEITSSLEKAIEAHKLQRVQIKIHRYAQFTAINDSKGLCSALEATDVLFEDYLIADILDASETDASNDCGSDTSTEIMTNTLYCSPVKLVEREKKRTMRRLKTRWPAKDSLNVPTMLAAPTADLSFKHRHQSKEFPFYASVSLPKAGAGGFESSAVQHVDMRQQALEEAAVRNLVSHELERLTVHSSPVGTVESGDPSVKHKPRTLLDAVKWENVKRKGAGSMH